MAKKANVNRELWEGIDINKDFQDALKNVEEVDLADYNEQNMLLFSANVNYARHLLRVSDSLKPVHRRILYTMYRNSLFHKNKKKSISMVGSTTDIHPHGGASVYGTMVGLGQYWKTPIPLVNIIGSYGTEVSAVYAADRYTEITMSDYAWKCFFQDFDSECVEMMFNTAGSIYEPVALPSRYPNAIINGGTGIAMGNAFRIPPFNVEEVVKATKKRMKNRVGHVYLVPDFPTSCDIVDDGETIKKICETGMGTLRMRAHIEIIDEGRNWALRVTDLPWGVSIGNIKKSLVELTESGVLPIKETHDKHRQKLIDGRQVIARPDYWIIIDKAHDPYAVREMLFKKTKLEESVAINFKLVLTDEYKLGTFSLAGLIDAWIDDRREYKRRLLNKRIFRATSQIETYKILIEILSGKNLETTVSIIRKSKEADIAANLVKKYGMSSYQATQIADMKLATFNEEAPAKYKELLKQKEKELDDLYDMVKSEERIDAIISAELDELKQYYKPRQSEVISSNGQVMDLESEYFLVMTKKGCIKKVSVSSVEKYKRGFGAFENGDFPIAILRGKNMDSIIFIDSFGKFSVVKMGDIPGVALNVAPPKAFPILKLEGEIISMRFFQNSESLKTVKKTLKSDIYIVTVSKNGVAKRTPLESIIEQTEDGMKTTKNARLTKLKPKDSLAHADYYLSGTNVLIYTKRGEYNFVTAEMFPEFGRDAYGNQLVKLAGTDECIGACAVSDKTPYVVLVTQKGKAKKVEVQYLGEPSASKATSYIMDIDPGDNLIYADTPEVEIDVMTKLGHQVIPLEDIKTLSRKAKGVKKVSLQPSDAIIQVVTR